MYNVSRAVSTRHVSALAVLCVLGFSTVAGCRSISSNGSESDQLLDAEQRALLAAYDEETSRGGAPAVASSDPGSPQIIVEAPDSTRPIKHPFAVKLKFLPESGATVDPSTFRLFLVTTLKNFDVTDRARQFLTVSSSGVAGENAPKIPSGKRRLLVEISDDRRRTARAALDVEIVN